MNLPKTSPDEFRNTTAPRCGLSTADLRPLPPSARDPDRPQAYVGSTVVGPRVDSRALSEGTPGSGQTPVSGTLDNDLGPHAREPALAGTEAASASRQSRTALVP